VRRSSPRVPGSVWDAFTALVGIGMVVGFLCGAGAFAGAAFLIFFYGALTVFVPWAVSRLDPALLSSDPAYKRGREKKHE
jgi:hypothetical protein